MIIFNDNVVGYLNLVAELGGSAQSQHLGVSPRLLLIYFGLCFIALGVIVYSVFCPNGVKYYGSANAYVGGVQDSVKRWAITDLEVSVSNFNQDAFEGVRDSYRRSWRDEGPTDQQRADYRNALLHIYYRQMNESLPFLRIFIWILYGIGLLCLSVPSAGVFLRVCKVLYRTLITQAGLIF